MPTIQVELIDEATQQLIARAELPAEQLPDSFEASTTLHLGEADWHVSSASAMTRAEYVAAGRLRLALRRIERVDPSKILYSLPTLENELPALRERAPDDGEPYRLHEDDWRQVELVAARFDAELAAELAAIREVRAQRRGAGFPRLHVRSRLAEPLAGVELRVADLRAALGPDVALRALAFGDGPGVVAGGFALVAGEGAVYGREEGGRLACLCLANGCDPAPLAALARAQGLRLVDWCAAELVDPARGPLADP